MHSLLLIAPLLVCFCTPIAQCCGDSGDHAGPVEFIQHTEGGAWSTIESPHFRLRAPADWSLIHDTLKSTDSKQRYKLVDDEGESIFVVTVLKGGPEFDMCFCAPQTQYEYSEEDSYKIWALTSHWKNKDLTRTVKVAYDDVRLDIHASLPEKNAAKIRYVAESLRPPTSVD